MKNSDTIQLTLSAPARGIDWSAEVSVFGVWDKLFQTIEDDLWATQDLVQEQWGQADKWLEMTIDGSCYFAIYDLDGPDKVVKVKQPRLGLIRDKDGWQAALYERDEPGHTIASLHSDGRWSYGAFRNEEKWSGHVLIIAPLSYFDADAIEIAPLGPRARQSALAG